MSMGLPFVSIYDMGLVLSRGAPQRQLTMDDPLLSMLVIEQSPTPLSLSPPLESMKTTESSSKVPWALYILWILLSPIVPLRPSALISSVLFPAFGSFPNSTGSIASVSWKGLC